MSCIFVFCILSTRKQLFTFRKNEFEFVSKQADDSLFGNRDKRQEFVFDTEDDNNVCKRTPGEGF